jgi:murein DD-endopeptidase MepM/ murein hydrolase activator NlpD
MRTSHSQPSIAALAAALLVVVSAPGVAQTSADSAPRARAPADSSVAGYGDRARQPGVDTSRSRPAADSALKAPAESSGTSSAPAPRGVPADSVLSSACTSMRPGGVAPGLLLVLFRDSADEKERLGRETVDLRLRAREMADLLNRAAFLYAVPASVWPRILAPEHRLLAAGPPEKIAAALPAFLRGLENGRAILEAREREDPAAAAELPSILPLGHTVFEPSAYFGPRRSPWTNAEEFLTGIEIAAPAGSPVVAPRPSSSGPSSRASSS